MAKGETFSAEKTEFADEETGHRVIQLTSSPSHDHHFYFTTTSFHPDGEHLFFSSARTGKFNIFSMDLKSGQMRQITECEKLSSLAPCLDSRGREVYYWDGPNLKASDIETLEERHLYTVPQGFRGGLLSIPDDGSRLVFAAMPVLELKTQTEKIYSGMQEMFERCDRTDIVVVPTDGSPSWVAYQENCWVSHVNVCPKDPDLILYCHEGSGTMVRQRMWLVRSDGSQRRPLRPQEPENALGHEYWHKDGETIGYHGSLKEGRTDPIFGLIKKDGSDCREYHTERATGHSQSSPDGKMHICDGAGLICRIEPGDGTARLIPLARHSTSGKIQIGHAHPIFSPDGKFVLFTSDKAGVCNVYMVEV